jgi:fructokinase
MIAVCGEALIDLVDQGGWTFRALPGGSPANVAVGLARLAIPAALLARVADDGFGRLLRQHLTDNGVDTRFLVSAAEPSTLAVVTLDPVGVASYQFYVHGTADWQWTQEQLPPAMPADVVALHAGSLALSVEPAATVLTELLGAERDRGQVTISFDPNLRPSFEPDREAAQRRVEHQVGLADLVKVSSEDLGWLLPGESPSQVARRWAEELGPAVVIVTLGGDGALAVGPNAGEVHRRTPTVELADTVGAGDAFTAGLLAALQDRKLLGGANRAGLTDLSADTLADVVDEAALVAAITCSRPGADPPTRDEVTAWGAPGPQRAAAGGPGR